MKKQSFIPKYLRQYPAHAGFYGITHSIYRSANVLLNVAQHESTTFSLYVHSSVVLFATTLESYFNQTLTTNLLAGKYGSREMIETLILGTNMSIHEKIRNVFLVYDRTQKGIDTK